MAEDKRQIQDPSTQGIGGIKGLEGINRLRSKEIDPNLLALAPAGNYVDRLRESYIETPPIQEIGYAGVGTSAYDKYITSATQLEDLSNTRGELQPWYAQVANGLAKGAVLAGTTFLNGTVGLVTGLLSAGGSQDISKLWDNDFSRLMQSVNEWSEEAIPNYYTNEELNKPWYENIFTSNFYGDKYLKNIGFTVGAFYSGGVWSKGTGKLGSILSKLGAGKKAASAVVSGTGAVLSAVNEGSIEALNGADDWASLEEQKLRDYYRSKLEDIYAELEATKGTLAQTKEGQLYDPAYIKFNEQLNTLQKSYQESLAKISEDRAKMGNLILLFNIGVLTASNLVQFGKLYSNGYNTARRTANIAKKAGKYTPAGNIPKLAMAAIGSPTFEAVEELSQSVITRVPGIHYSTDVSNFYKSKLDPEAEQETLNWIKSFGTGVSEALSEGESWEEAFLGYLTGAIGMPSFRGVKSASGGLQSPIYFREGVAGHIKDYREELSRANKIADYMNQRVQSPEFLNYYQGLIRHNKYQEDMNRAVEEEDEFNFKNAEHAQFVSDISMFDNAGKIEDLVTLINSTYDTSDENLESIVKNTTSTAKDGSKIGPFVDRDGNPVYATEDGKRDMIDKLTRTKDDMIKSISLYTKIKNDLDSKLGNKLSDDQLEELIWMESQLSDWDNRASSMAGEIKDVIGKVLGNFNSILNFNLEIRNREGKSHANLTDAYIEADKTIQSIEKTVAALEPIRSLDDDTFTSAAIKNPGFIGAIIQEVEHLDDNILDAQSKASSINKLKDLIKLSTAKTIYESKLKEYLDNPDKQINDHIKAKDAIKKKDTDKKSGYLKDKLTASVNLSEFKEILNNENDSSIVNNTLKELENEGNEMAKNYRETSKYEKEVKGVLRGLPIDSSTLQDAIDLFSGHSESSNNLDEISNLNSAYINDETIFDESSAGNIEKSYTRFLNAQSALQTAMSKVNNDNRFKSRFSEEYKNPVKEEDSLIEKGEREETGDSRTSTIPPVNKQAVPTQPELAVGDITQDDVISDNSAINNEVPTTLTLDRSYSQRPYYRPAIPELHIDASKEGDFRPFYEVVAERERGVDFSGIYNYLRDAGTFDYLNAANLREGSELGFMIDPNFNDHTIFIVDKATQQIVGSLDEGSRSVSRYVGLKELIDSIHREFNNRNNKESKDVFIATPTTRVSRVMIGKVPYSHESRSLSEIPGVLDGDVEPIFGIVRNGTLTTNGKVDDNLIIKPVDMSNKEGRLYLLIPNGAGKYSPAAVRVKHFNSEEFDLEDPSVVSTPMGKSIASSIEKLIASSSQDDVSEAMQGLSQDIHLQDVMVTWFDSPSGNGIVVSRKVRTADGSYEIINIDGKDQVREVKTSIYYNEKGLATVNDDFEADEATLRISGMDTSVIPLVPKDSNVIRADVMRALLSMNLPLQVSVGRINSPGYNRRIINSGVTTSNILEARTLGTWFTTDYFDKEGNLNQAISPASIIPEPRRRVETPVGGKDSAIDGVAVTLVHSGKMYYVDLKTNTIRDDQGQRVNVTQKNRILLDIAWADSNYGNATVGYNMLDNKVILPNGDVLDRITQKYITGDEAKNFKLAIEKGESDKGAKVAESKRVIGEIEENQRRVDKTKTDGELYYILEDDGEYHEYTRVHSRLGSNLIESPVLVEEINNIKAELQRLVDSPADYNSYLDTLSNKYSINLSAYRNVTDTKGRETIVNIIRDSKVGSNSQRALDAGSAVDSTIRQFFTSSDTSSIIRPSNMSEEAFTSLINSLIEVKSSLEQRGETFLTNNIVLFNKYADGSRVAGEVDILAIDKNGNFKIYDVKTSKYSFYEHKNSRGQTVDYFSSKAPWQRVSQKEYYTQQLSAYKNLFESQYGAPVTQLAIMPFVLEYSGDIVSGIVREAGIPISYSPSTPVPLTQKVKEVPSSPIFNSTLELQDPIDSIDENSKVELPNRKPIVGYYEIDGKLHKGYITNIGSVSNVNIHVVKVPNITTGFGKAEPHIASSSYGAIFPNGRTVMILKNSSTDTDTSAVNKIIEALKKNPQRIKEESSKETILNKGITHETKLPSLSYSSIQKEQAILEHDSEFEDDLLLREIDSSGELWDMDDELAWLDRVLPQLSKEGRIRIHDGLIRASGNRLAWGAFTGSLIVLSDRASRGTVYHEAFHIVSNTILSEKQRKGLYSEAKKLFGDLSEADLEERLAEDFRVWMQSGAKDTRTLGRKVLDFFKELLSLLDIQPSLMSYYVNINKGKYSTIELSLPSKRSPRKEELTNLVDVYDSRGEEGTILRGKFSKEKWYSLSNEERKKALECLSF